MRAMMSEQDVVTVAEGYYVIQFGIGSALGREDTSAESRSQPAATSTTSRSRTASRTGASPNGGPFVMTWR